MSDIKHSSKANRLKKGIYRHYKNKMYEVIGVSFHSESLEELVIYRAMYGEKFLWARPLKMFIENVEVDGKKMKRFTFMSEK